MTRRTGCRLLLALLAGAVLILADVAWSLWMNRSVKVTGYVVGTEAGPGLRAVLLSDLHGREFGEENRELIAQMEELQPDIICMAGDMLNGDEEDASVMLRLMEAAAAIAPTYVSYGNHEKEYEERFGVDLKPLMEAVGVQVLEREWVDLELNGRRIRIGGLYGYAMPAQPEFDGEEQRFLEAFQETDAEKLLLCHMPAAWIQWNSLSYWNVDLVLAGHTHGGQVRLPLLGGVYAPDQGWFPGFVSGRMELCQKTLIITSGLGSEGFIPRINNQPELAFIEF